MCLLKLYRKCARFQKNSIYNQFTGQKKQILSYTQPSTILNLHFSMENPESLNVLNQDKKIIKVENQKESNTNTNNSSEIFIIDTEC